MSLTKDYMKILVIVKRLVAGNCVAVTLFPIGKCYSLVSNIYNLMMMSL